MAGRAATPAAVGPGFALVVATGIADPITGLIAGVGGVGRVVTFATAVALFGQRNREALYHRLLAGSQTGDDHVVAAIGHIAALQYQGAGAVHLAAGGTVAVAALLQSCGDLYRVGGRQVEADADLTVDYGVLARHGADGEVAAAFGGWRCAAAVAVALYAPDAPVTRGARLFVLGPPACQPVLAVVADDVATHVDLLGIPAVFTDGALLPDGYVALLGYLLTGAVAYLIGEGVAADLAAVDAAADLDLGGQVAIFFIMGVDACHRIEGGTQFQRGVGDAAEYRLHAVDLDGTYLLGDVVVAIAHLVGEGVEADALAVYRAFHLDLASQVAIFLVVGADTCQRIKGGTLLDAGIAQAAEHRLAVVYRRRDLLIVDEGAVALDEGFVVGLTGGVAAHVPVDGPGHHAAQWLPLALQAVEGVVELLRILHIAGGGGVDVGRNAEHQLVMGDLVEAAGTVAQRIRHVVDELFFQGIVVLGNPADAIDVDTVATLVVELRVDPVVVPFQIADIGDVGASLGQIGELRRHGDEEVFPLGAVVILDQTQGRRDHGLVVGGSDGGLFQVDIQPVEAIGLHQTDDLIGKSLLLTLAQLDVRIGTAQRQQHGTALTVQLGDLLDKLAFTHADGRVELEGGDGIAAIDLHEGDIDHVVLRVDLIELDAGGDTALVARAVTPVVPIADHYAGLGVDHRLTGTGGICHGGAHAEQAAKQG